MTLEKINDDLVDFLPYEIDDSYIEKLFSDITNLDIRSKYSIPFYENIKDQYEILIDQKGPAILKEMVEYYYDKNEDLSIDTSILLNYFEYYASDLNIELKIDEVSKFIYDFKMQSNCSNYFSYVKYRLERMQLKRFTDPNYLYTEARDLSYFEEYLSNIIEFDLESNEKTYEYGLSFARKLSKKKNDIFKEENKDYKNKLYELKRIFLNFSRENYSLPEMKLMYGSLFSIINKDFVPFLYLIKDEGCLTDAEQNHYVDVINSFKDVRKRLISKIATIDDDNYKQKLKDIEAEYGINYSKVCACKRLSQDLEKKIRTYGRKEKEIKRNLKVLNIMKGFISSGQSIGAYCESKGIGLSTFYRYRDELELMKEVELGSTVDFVISKNNGGNVLDLFQIVDDAIVRISDKNKDFDMFEYSLQSQVSLKEVVDIAYGLKRDREAKIIDDYVNNNKNDFEIYHKDDYVGKINSNGQVFGEEEEVQLEKYLAREKLPTLVGIAIPVIYKILNNEELPSRDYQSKRKAYKVVIK